MIAKTFIERPVAAIVSAILISLLGLIAMVLLPRAMYPDITPPNITISGIYVGANATTVEETVLTPIENAINGVPDLMYIQGKTTNYGNFLIEVTFETGTNINDALLEVQNRIRQVEPILPEEVRRSGVGIQKSIPTLLKYVMFFSPNQTHSVEFITNYVKINVLPEISRIKGVGQAILEGAPFAMRVWLDPGKMMQFKISPQQVVQAIDEQNAQVAAGIIGRPPVQKNQVFEYNVQAGGKLTTIAEFESIIVAKESSGALVFLKDIARIELGEESYGIVRSTKGHKGAGFSIFPAPGANSLEVAAMVEEKMEDLKKSFPSDFEYNTPWDVTLFIKESLSEVVYIFFEALLLVVLVVFLFLQSWRATVISLLAIPVSILGTFAFLFALGFSVNSITLFGMILAIGIVVDDAIIVVEAVQHHIDHQKLSAKDATILAMKEISSPVIATALILAAVFVPVAFIPGITGGLFKQFAITISISVLISAFVALSLTPALCTMLMKGNPVHAGSKGLNAFFYQFNTWLEKQTGKYGRIIKNSLHHLKFTLWLLLGLFVLTGVFAKITPTSFLPKEDIGSIFITLDLPSATASGQTQKVLEEIEQLVLQNPTVENTVYVSEVNFLLGGVSISSSGTMFVITKDFKTRHKENLLIGQALIDTLYKELKPIKDANILILGFPPIDGLGNADGFSFIIKQNQGSVEELEQVANNFLAKLLERQEIDYAFSTFSTDVPNIQLKIDKPKAYQLDLTIPDINYALQVFLGGFYVNDFNLYNQNFKVFLQAEGSYRERVEQLSAFHVRNSQGDMIPLSNVVQTEFGSGAQVISHFNTKRAVEINGLETMGYSSGDVLLALQELAKTELPSGYTYEFAGASLQEVRSGNTATLILLLSLVFVFLFLAALYESWTVPFAVLAAIPIGILGAFVALYFAGFENSVYAQIALVTLIGLSAKTSILIVEFCKDKYEAGTPLLEAATQASVQRLRPILMTGLAFILGVVALMRANGAGYAPKNNLGWAVFGGMIAIVFVSIFFVPALYVFIVKITTKNGRTKNVGNGF